MFFSIIPIWYIWFSSFHVLFQYPYINPYISPHVQELGLVLSCSTFGEVATATGLTKMARPATLGLRGLGL